MYYVWKKALELENDFAYFSNEPGGFFAKPWISGDKIAAPPSIELVGDSDSPTTLSDVLLTGFELDIWSPRLVGLMSELGVENVQYLPVTIVNYKTKEKDTSYRIANVLGAIDCLDLANSQHRLASGGSVVLSVFKFRIHSDKVVPLPGMKRPPLIFRLGEFRRRILVAEKVQEACLKAEITGLKFVPPEVYV